MSFFLTLDNKGGGGGGGKVRSYLQDEGKGTFLIYQKRIKMALSSGTCWSETNCH